jgi:hypothetical protein
MRRVQWYKIFLFVKFCCDNGIKNKKLEDNFMKIKKILVSAISAALISTSVFFGRCSGKQINRYDLYGWI